MEATIDNRYNLKDVVEIDFISKSGKSHKRIGAIIAVRATVTDDGNASIEYKVKEKFFPEDSIVGRYVKDS